MKTSLIIPSTNNHFQYIGCILEHYKNGTVKPDEVIVSVSKAHEMDKREIKNIVSKYDNCFENLKIVSHFRKVYEGPNRGEGSKVAENDLLIYQDSDDVPHPQRIEIIKYFFENHDILHLNHGYNFEEKFEKLNVQEIENKKSHEMFDMYFPDFKEMEQVKRTRKTRPRKVYDSLGNSLPYGSGFGPDWNITGGSTAILKSVLEEINWEWTMDVSYDYDFCMDTLFYYNKSMLINVPLIWYNKTGNMNWACGD
jgi:hypothetical protein